jgi:adhesin HecA-like repeat protein
VRSGGLFDLRAATSLDLRAGTTGRLESTATMTIRGSVVNIN